MKDKNMDDKLREKHVADQPQARGKTKTRTTKVECDYTKEPQKEADQKTENDKRAVTEANDYKGTRSIDDDRNLTEKGSKKK